MALVVLVGTIGAPRAEEARVERSRGPASVVGLTLLALSVGGAGLGLSGLLISSDAQGALAPLALEGAPTSSEALISERLEQRLQLGTTLAAAGWAAAGIGLVGGIILLVVDAPTAPQLAVIPIRGGGLVSYSFSW